MSLREKQSRFARCVVRLLLRMEERGYEYTFGESKRSDEQAEINAIGEQGRAKIAKGVANDFPNLALALLNNGKANGVRLSTHKESLGMDINLFKNGVYLSSSADHREFGEWWKQQDPEACWGGDFKPAPDGNHYSFMNNGVK